jgi:NitT/TauT family transport system ATP-binding protein
MLKFVNVSFSHDNGTLILDRFNIKFHDKKINCLLAPNGSGKTTILKLIGNILKPNKGKIVNTNKKVSYVFQEDRLIEEITVFQNLDLIIQDIYEDKSKRENIILKYLKLANIEKTKELYPHELSGSMRQRVSLVRAFIYPSQLMLLDEPYVGLDINARRVILELAIKLWKQTKRTFIFVSHDIDVIASFAHYAYIFSNKPITILKEFAIKTNLDKRDLYSAELNKFKKEFYELTKK